MSQSSDERDRKSPPSSAQPPQPRRQTAPRTGKPPNASGAAGAPPSASGKAVYLLDRMTVKDLALALQLKPFKVVADLIELKHFKSCDDPIDFETAALIARKHGYRPEKPPPGMLVL